MESTFVVEPSLVPNGHQKFLAQSEARSHAAKWAHTQHRYDCDRACDIFTDRCCSCKPCSTCRWQRGRKGLGARRLPCQPQPWRHKGNSDPFASTSIPVDYFHQHLLPIYKKSWTSIQLNRVSPKAQDGDSAWLRDLFSTGPTSNVAYLYAYGLQMRMPHRTVADTLHENKVRAAVLLAAQKELQSGKITHALVQLNFGLISDSFFRGQREEFSRHCAAQNEIVRRLGGPAGLNKVVRDIVTASGTFAAQFMLLNPRTHSFLDNPRTWYEESAVTNYHERYQVPAEFPTPSVQEDAPLSRLLASSREFLFVYEIYRAKNQFMTGSDPVRTWLDTRHCHCAMMGVQEYYNVIQKDSAQEFLAEQTDATVLLKATLALAISHCRQIIYLATRAPGGLLSKDTTSPPERVIPVHYLWNHLERFTALDRDGLVTSANLRACLWAHFVLSCFEQVACIRVGRHYDFLHDQSLCWSGGQFSRLRQKLPFPQTGMLEMQAMFEADFLFSNVLEPFLAALVAAPVGAEGPEEQEGNHDRSACWRT